MSSPQPLSFLRSPPESFSQKLKLTLSVFSLNSILVLLLMYIGYLFLSFADIELMIKSYKESYSRYFLDFDSVNLTRVFWQYSVTAAVTEEFIFRYPVLLLVRNNFKFTNPNRDFSKHLIIGASLGLNFVWSFGYPPMTMGHTMFLPIFISGLPPHWLTVKTRVMWPGLFCHAAWNLILYFFIQLLLNVNFGPITALLSTALP